MAAVAQIELSPSFANALSQFAEDEPVTAWVVVQQLLKLHPEYGGGLGERLLGGGEPTGGTRRTAQAWVAGLNDLFDAEAVELIHGRLAIWGLAQLDPVLKGYLESAGFLEALEQEMRARDTTPEDLLREQTAGSEAVGVELPETAEAALPEMAEALALEANRDVDSVLLLAGILYEGAVAGSVNVGLAVLEAMGGGDAAAQTSVPSPEVRVMEALGLAEHYGLSAIPTSPVTSGTPAGRTAEVEAALARAMEIARQAGQRTAPHKRDLLAALLGRQVGDAAPVVQGYLSDLGQDVEALRGALLEHVRAYPYGDDVNFWEQVLLPPGYLPPNAGYVSDVVYIDKPERLGPDRLDIAAEVNTFAHVLMSRQVQPPLSLGLFGDWGSGKSFFIGKLRTRIGEIAAYYRRQEQESGERSAWCSRVVQIDFNAWHFSDANLWASLVTRIYDALYAELSDDAPSDRETRERLKVKVQEAEGRLLDAEAQLEKAKVVAGTAEMALQQAAQERIEEEESLRGLIDDVQGLLRGGEGEEENEERAKLRRQLNEAAENLGYPEAAKSYVALQELNGDLQNFSQRLAALGLHAIQSPWALLLLLIAVVGLPLAVSIVLETPLDGWVQEGGEPIIQAGSLLLGLVTWLKIQIGRGLALIETVEGGLREVEKARRERIASSPEVRQAQQQFLAAQAKEAAARSNLEEARRELYRLQSALEELRPETRLFRLLEERSSSGAYTQHLGIISLIRSDFENISDLLRELDEEARDLQEEAPPIQRIMLYIDDLDRCRPERVVEVLEAVHMLLAFPLFIVVVGVDPRWLRRSLSEHYAYTLGKNEDGEEEERASLMAANRATPQQYLEKIFQIPFALRPVEKDGYERLVADLMRPLAGGDGVMGTERDSAQEEDEQARGERERGEGQGDAIDAGSADGEGSAARAAGESSGSEVGEGSEEDADTVDSGTGGDAAAEPGADFAPLNAEQLEFTAWEEEDIKRLWPMFRTPRTVKRFVNIYRLLRAGLQSEEAVKRFEGSEEKPGGYQVAMLLLAVVTGYADQATRFLTAVDAWLDGVEAQDGEKEQEWSELVAALKGVEDGGDDSWRWLTDCVQQVTREGKWQPFKTETMRSWALRVSRYSFALDSSQGVYEQ